MPVFQRSCLAVFIVCSFVLNAAYAEEDLPFESAIIETTTSEMRGNADFSVDDNGGSSNFTVEDSSIFYQDPLFEMYPEYERLSRRLGSISSSEIENYAKRYYGSALAEKLTADYVESRVRARDFSAANTVIRYIQNPDFSEECAIAAAKFATGSTKDLLQLKSKIWLKSNIPPTCKVANELLAGSSSVTKMDMLARLFFLLRNNQTTAAADISSRLGAFLDKGVLSTDYFAEGPISNDDIVGQARFIYAVSRQSDLSPFQAQTLVQSVSGLPDYLIAAAYRVIAMSTTGKYVVNNGYLPQTLEWFKASRPFLFSNDEAVAYAQAAIRFNDYPAVIDAIYQMSAEKQKERGWQYWLARANDKNRNTQDSKRIYQSLIDQDDYYGLMARYRLNQPFILKTTSFNVDSPVLNKAFQDQNSFQRALHLKGLPNQSQAATREWNWGVWQSRASGNNELLIKAASEATKLGWYDRAIFALEKLENLNAHDLSHPAPYLGMIQSGSSMGGIPAAWALGIMRQESRFVPRAKSYVGATGLMQVMPATGKWIAKQLGESYSASTLHDIGGNIRYGTFYLGSILGKLDNNVVLATAGYNAGPGRARRWQANDSVLEADQYIESIPFNETRDYVKQVLTNAIHYDALLNKQHTINTGNWFPTVRVKNEFN